MGNKLKAYKVSPKYDFYSEVIFAETAGQAKSFALSMDSCSEYSFTELEVRRMPNLDKYYKEGKRYFEWDNPQDRVVLVKEAGFVCDDETYEYEDCEVCPAKKYCDKCSN